MNRLVIIGNGFDLAHGLPTSYGHFIDDYWKGVCKTKLSRKIEYDKDDFVKLSCELGSMYNDLDCEAFNNIRSYKELMTFVEKNKENGYGYFEVNFKNSFFKIICDKSIENWVDVENLYYEVLKSKSKEGLGKHLYYGDVYKLNKEFEQVKNLLKAYLIKTFDERYNWFDVKKNEIEDHLKEEPNILEFLFDKENEEYYKDNGNLNLKDTLLLSFNYTKIVEDYSNYMRNGFSCNYIHGEIFNEKLPIIFGFGDEMDENYTNIENINDNEYLKNFKSIQYLEHSNYKNLYNFIEAEPFQVFIMGHSCGLSDRTLLSMIFENENCLSVKVFYHQKSKVLDNYTEIIQNISRHFKDKKMLRNKVVEKRHCKPLIKFDSK